MPINAAWHAKHRMPKRATPARSLKWHEAHAKHCGCRPFTAAMREKLKRRVMTAEPDARMPRVNRQALAQFFKDAAKAARLHTAVERAVARIGPSRERVSKSQVAFQRRISFAWTWQGKQYLGPRGAPLVLSLSLRRHERSRRWKEVVEPSKGRFMHHLELYRVADVDAQVRNWLAEAWEAAG